MWFRVLLLFFTFNLLSQQVMAQAQTSPKCLNMMGENQSCSKNESETFFAYKLTSFVGDREKSFTGSFSHGLSITNIDSRGNFSWLMGLQVGYGNMLASIASTYYGATLMAVDIPIGFSLKMFRSNWVRPVIDVYGLAGFKSLELASPPSGVDNKTLSFNYGYGVSIGLELGLARFTALRASADYETNSAQNLANQSGFKLDALAYRLGFVVTY